MENIRNQDNISGIELLAVSFGTSFNESRLVTIGAIEDTLEAAFPAVSVRRAFTSGMILRHIRERDGVAIDSIADALERAKKNEVKRLVIQPTHLMDGNEYHKLMRAVQQVQDSFDKVSFGAPLLTSEEDFRDVAKAVLNFLAPHGNDKTAFALMGHGTDAESNAVYARLQETFTSLGADNVYVGTVEAKPDVQDILADIRKGDYRKVVMMPLMVVAGDHANNDMAGEEEGSWNSVFKAAGYETECIVRGLGELEEIRSIYVRHAAEALSRF